MMEKLFEKSVVVLSWIAGLLLISSLLLLIAYLVYKGGSSLRLSLISVTRHLLMP